MIFEIKMDLTSYESTFHRSDGSLLTTVTLLNINIDHLTKDEKRLCMVHPVNYNPVMIIREAESNKRMVFISS